VPNKIVRIKTLSQATSVPGQGVGSAYLEQIHLLHQSKLLEVYPFNSKIKPDVYHVHTVNLRYWFLMRFTELPTIVYVHFLPSTLSTSIRLPKLFFVVLKWYVKIFYRTADHLVVVNPIFINPLVAMGIPRECITFIPNYVNPAIFHTSTASEVLRLKHQFNRFTVLGVGQVQQRKGVLDFIEVAKALPDIDFVWAGGFSFKGLTSGYDDLKKVMDNPPRNVRFLGIVARDTMKELYKACDLFFLPSFDELMPMSVLEAAISDKPILLRDLTLYEPVFFEHYLKAHSVAEFVKMIKHLASDPQAYQAALKKTEALKKSYRQDTILKQWEVYYQKVVTQHGQTH
jgi:1,2-diacylglycerol-3-alpha-glucose alpha-1,2-galactosyltransferase